MQGGSPGAPTATFELQPIAPHIGVEVTGIDLNADLDDDTITTLRQALVRHKVLVFRDQPITPAAHVAFARRFGDLEVHPVFPRHPDHPELVLLGGDATDKARENVYHRDVSWRAKPSMASLLRCIECPPAGGDTIWVNMAVAYEQLPATLKPQLTQLHAVHDILPAFGTRLTADQRAELARTYPPMTHPVVRTHPESGEQILYVNEAFTTHLANYADAFEPRFRSDFKVAEMDLLHYLLRQAATPEYQMQLRWRPDTLVIWDNRSTQHYAVQDYFPAVRRMMRATVTVTNRADTPTRRCGTLRRPLRMRRRVHGERTGSGRAASDRLHSLGGAARRRRQVVISAPRCSERRPCRCRTDAPGRGRGTDGPG